jgi:hypothetical protein
MIDRVESRPDDHDHVVAPPATTLHSTLEIGPPGATVLALQGPLGCRVFRQIDGSAGGIATMGTSMGTLAGTSPVCAVALASARL